MDPASSKQANSVVKATRYYSLENDGLSKHWKGRVWMNPPYASDLIPPFIEKLVKGLQNGTGSGLGKQRDGSAMVSIHAVFSGVFSSGQSALLESSERNLIAFAGASSLVFWKESEDIRRSIQAFWESLLCWLTLYAHRGIRAKLTSERLCGATIA